MLYLSNFLILNVGGADYFVNLIVPAKSFLDLAFGFSSIVLVSPICEELIFRGLILNKLQLVVPKIFALFISSLLFASLHSFGSIFSAFIFALCMGIIYLKTENIIVPVFAHFLNNFIAETIVHIDYNSVLFNNEIVVGFISILAVISFALILRSVVVELKNFK